MRSNRTLKAVLLEDSL